MSDRQGASSARDFLRSKSVIMDIFCHNGERVHKIETEANEDRKREARPGGKLNPGLFVSRPVCSPLDHRKAEVIPRVLLDYSKAEQGVLGRFSYHASGLTV